MKAKHKGVGHTIIRRPQSDQYPWDKPQARPISAKAAPGRQDTPAPPAKVPEIKSNKQEKQRRRASTGCPGDDPRGEDYFKQTGPLRWAIRQREIELAQLPPGPTRDAVLRELKVLRDGGMGRYLGTERAHPKIGTLRTWQGLKAFLEEVGNGE